MRRFGFTTIAAAAFVYCCALNQATPSEYCTCGNAGSIAAACSNSSAARPNRSARACMTPRFRYTRASVEESCAVRSRRAVAVSVENPPASSVMEGITPASGPRPSSASRMNRASRLRAFSVRATDDRSACANSASAAFASPACRRARAS